MVLDHLTTAFTMAMDPSVLIVMFIATVVGVIVGALPGLGTVTALAMILPFTFVLSAPEAIGILLAIYVSSVYGGAIPAVLINVPGTPQSAATTFDGYPMAKQGKSAEALAWVTIASFLGGVLSIVVLIFATPQLVKISIQFGAIETFALIVFSLTSIAWVSKGNPIKGLMAATFGIVLSTVGIDELSGTQRFTFGYFALSAGLHVVPILIGLFALSEVFYCAGQKPETGKKTIFSSGFKISPLSEWLKVKRTILRSSAIGTFLGILPGVGAAAASLIGYAQAKSVSKRKEKFGTGEPEGIVASETANNAVTGGALVPTLALSIPGDAPTAVMLGALIVHGITPGYQLFTKEPELVNFIFVALLFANIMLLMVGAGMAQVFSRILKIPHALIMASVVVLSLAGSYVIRFSIADVWIALVAGVVGVLLRYAQVPIAPIIIGFILGPPLENNLRQGLIVSQMDFLEFFKSPIALTLFAMTALVVTFPLVKKIITHKQGK